MSAAKPYNQFRALRPEYLALTDGNPCAALILDLFTYWTQVRASNDEQARGGGEDGNDLWFYRTLPDIGSDLYDAFGRSAVRAALKLLSDKGMIETRTNPDDPRDRTTQYRLVTADADADASRPVTCTCAQGTCLGYGLHDVPGAACRRDVARAARDARQESHPPSVAPSTVQDAISHDGEGAKSNALARASDPQLRDLLQETSRVGGNTDVARERERPPQPHIPSVVDRGSRPPEPRGAQGWGRKYDIACGLVSS